ncbi:MAG TPA: hypothetical protein VF472_24750 [Burkholderiaceae bacterium]
MTGQGQALGQWLRVKSNNPVAEEQRWLLLIEPATTKHTGDEVTDKTRSYADQARAIPGLHPAA